jgi:hypothetical protein
MPRPIHVTKKINEFLRSTKTERKDLLSFGVEIETQCDSVDELDDRQAWAIVYDNLDYESYVNTEELYEAVYEATRSEIETLSFSEIFDQHIKLNYSAYTSFFSQFIKIKNFKEPRWYSKKTIARGKITKWIKTLILNEIKEREKADEEKGLEIDSNEYKLNIYNKYAKIFDWHEIDDLFDSNSKFFESIEEEIERDAIDESDFYLDIGDLKSEYPELFSEFIKNDAIEISNNEVEIVDDQSVTGKELRTRDGYSYGDLLEISGDIFESIKDSEHYIDESCSAHLHLKLGEIRHFFGQGVLHQQIMEYIAFNLHRLPESVRDRLSGGGNRWIKPRLIDGKYTWVRFHPQGTIEFRLFGNIDNVEELKECIDFAVDALTYGYRKQKLKRRFQDDTPGLETNEIIEKCSAA